MSKEERKGGARRCVFVGGVESLQKSRNSGARRIWDWGA